MLWSGIYKKETHKYKIIEKPNSIEFKKSIAEFLNTSANEIKHATNHPLIGSTFRRNNGDMKVLYETEKLVIEYEYAFFIEKSTNKLIFEDDFYDEPEFWFLFWKIKTVKNMRVMLAI